MRARLSIAVAAMVALATAAVPAGSLRATAAPAAGCPTVPIWAVGDGSAGDGNLIEYQPDGMALRASRVGHYLDIAMTPAGTMYATAGQVIDRLDPTTGAVLQSVRVIGGAAKTPGGLLSGLGVLPDGRLIAGEAGTELFWIDPASGNSDTYALLPDGNSTHGDVVAMPDGDVLVAALSAAGERIARVHPDGSTTFVGNLPYTYGMTLSDDRLLTVGPAGKLVAVDLPIPTVSSAASLPTTVVADVPANLQGLASMPASRACSRPSAGTHRGTTTANRPGAHGVGVAPFGPGRMRPPASVEHTAMTAAHSGAGKSTAKSDGRPGNGSVGSIPVDDTLAGSRASLSLPQDALASWRVLGLVLGLLAVIIGALVASTRRPRRLH